MRLNKMGIAQRMCTAKDFTDYLKTHDARVSVVEGQLRQSEKPKQAVFGRKNRYHK